MKSPEDDLLDAAERVRIARTLAAWRRDEESAAELAAALADFQAVKKAHDEALPK